MKFELNEIKGFRGIKIQVEKDGKIAGRVFLYIINNDLHEEPYGLLEDLFVEEEFRGQGIAKELVKMVIEQAKDLNCYKLITQSRYGREGVHEMYKKAGFVDYGKNFRIDLS